jgi:hypothetical protein
MKPFEQFHETRDSEPRSGVAKRMRCVHGVALVHSGRVAVVKKPVLSCVLTESGACGPSGYTVAVTGG